MLRGPRFSKPVDGISRVTQRRGIPIFAAAKRRFIMEKATFGAGCFWGVEQFFREVPGVSDETARRIYDFFHDAGR